MIKSEQNNNNRLAARFRAALKPREFLLHDGRKLRRLRIGRRVQLAAGGAAMSLLAFSGFGAVQLASAAAPTGDVAQMQRQVAAMEQDVAQIRAAADQRAQVLEQRQAFLQAMLAGADADQVARLLPQRPGTPASGAAQAVTEEFAAVDGMQLMLAAQADQATRARIAQTSGALRRLGIDPRRLTDGVGGPFEEVSAGDNDTASTAVATSASDADPRFLQLFSSWRQMERLEQGVASIPSTMPVNGARWTSSFGVRSDPFRGRAAMHAGIDMAGPVGTPIYATADGEVGRAGVVGAYGNLVELQHGAGINTRYGHLSRIMVRAGERVRRGQLIGLMGSTGRSTGSHLHYEVRVDGRAINPVPFLESGRALAAVQGGGGQGGARR